MVNAKTIPLLSGGSKPPLFYEIFWNRQAYALLVKDKENPMPLKPQDTDKLNPIPADRPGKTDRKKQDEEKVRDIKVGYGSARDAELNTAADTTNRQEYDANGLPRTTKYSVDKDGVR
jgi:hypothetical protein